MSKVPNYASDIPYVPMNWGDRDSIVGKLMEILEAVIPEGKQLEATKGLVKRSLSEYFTHSFNDAFKGLTNTSPTVGYQWDDYVKALWEECLKQTPKENKETGSN